MEQDAHHDGQYESPKINPWAGTYTSDIDLFDSTHPDEGLRDVLFRRYHWKHHWPLSLTKLMTGATSRLCSVRTPRASMAHFVAFFSIGLVANMIRRTAGSDQQWRARQFSYEKTRV